MRGNGQAIKNRICRWTLSCDQPGEPKRPFQDRFKALVVEPGAAFSGVCDYIHLNPVRAHAVAIEHMLEYPWSSLAKWARQDRPAWLDPRTVLGERGGLPDSAIGWEKHHATLVLAARKLARVHGTRGRMSRGWCLGALDFRARMKERMIQKGMELLTREKNGQEPASRQWEREAAWEESLRRLANCAQVNLERLPENKSDPSKALLAAAMKRRGDASNAWLARRLRLGEATSVSQIARRFAQRGGDAEIDALLSRVQT